MPPKHQVTKTHKKMKYSELSFSEIWCFGALVAKGIFLSGLNVSKFQKSFKVSTHATFET